jgi:peroxiredoxin Q/BCP
VAYFAASCDDPDTNKKFAESLGLDYPILSDPTKAVAKAYGVLGAIGVPSRTTIYIDGAGKIAFVDKDVKPKTHGKDLAARLAELGVPRKQEKKD